MLLEIVNVSKHFGGLRAIDNISTCIDSGEIIGLIGPNGAGKTTLFNVISGVYKQSTGAILLKKENIAGLSQHKVSWKGIARTFQRPQPFNGLTVFENIAAAKFFCGDRRKIKYSIPIILELLNLEHVQDMDVENLTAQEQKRVEIGKALACNPELLLLDEVAAGLTLGEHELMRNLILKIRDHFCITIIVIEHIMETIMTISDRIIVLNYGQILKDGTPGTISKDRDVIEAYLGKEFITNVRG